MANGSKEQKDPYSFGTFGQGFRQDFQREIEKAKSDQIEQVIADKPEAESVKIDTDAEEQNANSNQELESKMANDFVL